jgi:hypothetical protein
MRIKRKILRKIILEAITTTRQGTIAVKGMMPTKQYPEAVMVTLEDTKKLIKALSVTSKYKTKPQYIWKDSKAGASEELYTVGELTNGNGDPFTYNKEGNKYRVISGPEPKTIGKLFTMDPPPSINTDNLEAGATEVSARQNVLDMTMEEYREFLNPNQKNIFDNWPIFATNAKKTVLDWFSNDAEIIRKDMEDGQAAAIYVKEHPKKAGVFRAPIDLIDAYAKGPDDQGAFEEVSKTALDSIMTDELRSSLEEED